MIVALASPRVATTLDDAIDKVGALIAEASQRGARIVCFPEAYLPGLRGQDFAVPHYDAALEERALAVVAGRALRHRITVIAGMEHLSAAGRQIASFVIDERGETLGYQTKNQLDPTEDRFYVPGEARQLFAIDGLTFGVAICHEGYRYPETVRWAAARGAQIVFHPQCTGSDTTGTLPSRWGDADGPWYEKAMMCRSLENTIWFASVNYALRYQQAATSLIAPSGRCVAHLPYGAEGVLVADIDPAEATGLLAERYAPERYRQVPPS